MMVGRSYQRLKYRAQAAAEIPLAGYVPRCVILTVGPEPAFVIVTFCVIRLNRSS